MLSAAEPEPPLSRSPSSATVITSDSRTTTSRAGGGGNIREKLGLGGVARRTLGIGLLLIVVFLWTLSNFMASVSPTIPSTFNIT
jgi:solute carrier family 35 protein F5